MLAVAVGCLGFVVALGAVEVLHRQAGMSSEYSRRVAHVATALIAVLLPIGLSNGQIVVMGIVFAVALAFSKRRRLLESVHGVARRTWGEVMFPLGIAALAAFDPAPLTYTYGVLVLGLGDAAAGTVGQLRGRHPFHIGRASKTLEGSAALLATTTVIGIIVLAIDGSSSRVLLVAIAAAAVAVLVEAAMPWGLDNLVLPLASAGSLWTFSEIPW